MCATQLCVCSKILRAPKRYTLTRMHLRHLVYLVSSLLPRWPNAKTRTQNSENTDLFILVSKASIFVHKKIENMMNKKILKLVGTRVHLSLI
jgi:hypothetical protein